MIESQFIGILKKNNVSDKDIDYIFLSKKIKRILGRKLEEIERIIKLLKNENIEVRNCSTVLAYGKAEEIERIIKLLKDENIEVRSCLSILARGKIEEIEKIIKLLKDENI